MHCVNEEARIKSSLVTLGLAPCWQFGGAIIGYGSVSAFIIIPLLFIELKPMPGLRILNCSRWVIEVFE